MKCNKCPLLTYYGGESEDIYTCDIFGDDWGSPFQYEDKDGEIIGCYIEPAYIRKVQRKVEEMYDEAVNRYKDDERARANDERQTAGDEIVRARD